VYNQALQANPNFVEAYSERGTTRFWHGQKQAAIEDFTKIIQLRPEVRSPAENDYLNIAYLFRGRTYIDLGNPKAAIADFDWMLSQKYSLNQDLAYIFRGIARDKLRDFQGAIEDFTKAITEKSFSRNKQLAYNFRGITYVNIKDIPGAIQDFTKAIEVAEHEIEIGNSYPKDSLLKDDERAKALLPSNYMSRGRAYAKLGDKQRAIADLQKAAQLAFEQKQLELYTTANAEIQKLR
jgi:tetratricopeptide (TPR) repeat protein